MHADGRAAAVQPAVVDAGPAPITLSNFFSELLVRCSLECDASFCAVLGQ